MTLMWAAIRGYRAERKFPGVLTDDELRAISVPVLLITGARSAMLTPAEARARGSLMPHAEVAIVPGSHGGFNRIDELNDRIAAFIKAHATDKQAGSTGTATDNQPLRPASSPDPCNTATKVRNSRLFGAPLPGGGARWPRRGMRWRTTAISTRTPSAWTKRPSLP